MDGLFLKKYSPLRIPAVIFHQSSSKYFQQSEIYIFDWSVYTVSTSQYIPISPKFSLHVHNTLRLNFFPDMNLPLKPPIQSDIKYTTHTCGFIFRARIYTHTHTYIYSLALNTHFPQMLDEHALPISSGGIRSWKGMEGGGCKDLSRRRRIRAEKKKGFEGWLGRYNEFFSNSIIVARSNYSRRFRAMIYLSPIVTTPFFLLG